MKSKGEIKYEVATDWGYINWGDLLTDNFVDHDYIESAYSEVIDRYVEEVEKNYENHYTELNNRVMCECGNCFKIRGSLV